jgi:hypothetical protein
MKSMKLHAILLCLFSGASHLCAQCIHDGNGISPTVLQNEADPDSPEVFINGIEFAVSNSDAVFPLPTGLIESAISQWNGCSPQLFPPLQTSVSGPKQTITISFFDKKPPPNTSEGLGLASYSNLDQEIKLYRRNPNGGFFSQDELIYFLAHEIGHVLGLGDTSRDELMGPARGDGDGYKIQEVLTSDCTCVSETWEYTCQ